MRLGLGLGLHRQRRGGPQPALSFDFEHMGTLPTDLAVARTGLAGMWQDDGTLGFGPHNLLLQADTLTSATWTKTRVSATDATTIVEDGTTGAHRVEQGLGTVPANTAATYRCQVKRGVGSRQFAMQVVASDGTDHFTVFFDLGAGTVGAVSVVGTAAVASSTIVATDDGYWRVTIVATVSTSAVLASVRCEMSSGTTAGSDSYAGDGVSSLLVRRIQVNIGTAASEYVATTTAARYLMRFEKHPSTGRRGLVGERATTNVLTNPLLAGGGSPPTGWTAASGSGTATASVYGSADGAVAYSFTSAASRNFFSQNYTLANNTTYACSVLIESVSGTVPNNEVLWTLESSLPAGCTITGWTVNGVASTGATAAVAGKLGFTIGGNYTGAAIGVRFGCGCGVNVTGTVVCSRPQFEAYQYNTSFVSGSRLTDTIPACTVSASLGALFGVKGTVFADFAWLHAPSSAYSGNRIALRLDNNAADTIYLYNHAGYAGCYMSTGGIARYSANTGVVINGFARTRIAMSWGPTQVRGCVNGSLLTAAAAFTAGWTPTHLRFCAGQLGVIVFRGGAFADVLTDAELQALTAA